mmetsp:Transcript_2431/g.4822  ORF Transcript_2431/g.4822 Transcript_2431/m.4822 type:complete len:114 (+) Transcript_2431:743-1084(+)
MKFVLASPTEPVSEPRARSMNVNPLRRMMCVPVFVAVTTPSVRLSMAKLSVFARPTSSGTPSTDNAPRRIAMLKGFARAKNASRLIAIATLAVLAPSITASKRYMFTLNSTCL